MRPNIQGIIQILILLRMTLLSWKGPRMRCSAIGSRVQRDCLLLALKARIRELNSTFLKSKNKKRTKTSQLIASRKKGTN
jgi:hypothetical protein